MLRIVDAQKTDNLFSAYYIPENTNERGFISMHLDGTVVEEKLTSLENLFPTYASYAKREMRRCLKENIIPHGDPWLVMWY